MGNTQDSKMNNGEGGQIETPILPESDEELEGHGLPNFVVLKSHVTGRYAYYATRKNRASEGYVSCEKRDIFNTFAKIEVETAKINRKYVHLRFCYSNKYWSRGRRWRDDDDDGWLVASSDQPDEDTSKESCTLFEPTREDGGLLYLIHVQSGKRVRPHGPRSTGDVSIVPKCAYIDDRFVYSDRSYGFTLVDWDTLVIMPKYVAFKGNNGKYLRAGWIEGYEYLQFSSDDGNDKRTAYEITMDPDGYLLIKSNYFGKYWRRSPNWIWADSTQHTVGKDVDTLFWPVKVNKNTIALRNAGNGSFCKALTTEGKTECLNAAVSTITMDARLQVEELVLERYIYDTEYRIDHARVYDEKAFVVGTGAATNNTQEKATLSIRVSYRDNSSYSFSNSSSIKLGVSASIKAGLPFITEEGINVSTETTNSLEWGRVTEKTITAEATYEAVVPPMSTVRVHYVATQGKCNVPFSYTQRDKLSGGGGFVRTRNIDGVYTGVNYYDFRFEQVLKR